MRFGVSDTADVVLYNTQTGEEILKLNSINNKIETNRSEVKYKYKVEMQLENGEVFEYGTNTIEFTKDGERLITDRFEFVIDSKTIQMHEGFTMTHQTKENVDE